MVSRTWIGLCFWAREVEERVGIEWEALYWHGCVSKWKFSCWNFLVELLGFELYNLCNLMTEVSLKNKEEELNMIIEELRKNFESVQVQLAREQTEKLVSSAVNSRLITCVYFIFAGFNSIFFALGGEWFSWKRERSKNFCWKGTSWSHRRARKSTRRSSNG